MQNKDPNQVAPAGKILGQQFGNPLHKFQSYSTHFILLACRTTEAARYFANNHAASDADAEAVNLRTLDAINETQALGDAVKFSDGTTVFDDEVFLVIDTRRFGQFTIDTMKYDVLINGVQGATSHANLATEIEMTILDNTGISFINFMQWLLDTKMQTNFDGMVFLLRVMFVGHNPDRSVETITSCTLPMHLLRMEVNLDFAKGIYNCTFLPNINFSTVNGAKWLNIGAANRYFTGEGTNKLGDIITSFVNALNQESSRFYSQISNAMKQGNQIAQNDRFGRRVEYVITIPDNWYNFIFTGPGVHEAIERNFEEERKRAAEAAKKTEEQKKKEAEERKKRGEPEPETEPVPTGTHAQSSNLAVENSMTIPQVLDIIFKQVQEIKEFANGEKLTADDKVVKFYNYVVGITSNKEIFQVQVHVVPFEVPNVPPPTAKQREEAITKNESRYFQLVEQEGGRVVKVPKDFYELDYIFTGKNVDILNFDMKIENLAFLLASNVRVGAGQIHGQALDGQNTDVKNEKKVTRIDDVLFARKYDPIFIPQMTEEERDAFSKTVAFRKKETMERAIEVSQQYTRNLSAFYANSPIVINVAIRGNPKIMLKFSDQKPMKLNVQTTQGARGVSSVTTTSLQQLRKSFVDEMLSENDSSGMARNDNGTFRVRDPIGDSRYYSRPVFFRVNIKGPNVDPRSNELIAGENFATEVLQDNYYVVFKVSNTIDKGVFTQELELYSHNIYGLNKLDKDELAKQRVTLGS